MIVRHDNGSRSIFEVAIEPKLNSDLDRLVAALDASVTSDPSLRYSQDQASGQTVLFGQSEQQLLDAARKIDRELGVGLNVGGLQVSYRERVSRAVEISYTHAKVMAGGGEFALVGILFEPGATDSGFVFESRVERAQLKDEHIAGVVKGLEAVRQNGALAGFPVIDFAATLIAGAFHDFDSSARTFEIAARAAFRLLQEKRAIELLEPILAVEVETPDEFLGVVIGDLNARRGQVATAETEGEATIVKAMVPAATMIGYLDHLRATTRSQGEVSLRFDHYEAVPRSLNDDDPYFPPAAAMRMRA